jgi:spermidine synthase
VACVLCLLVSGKVQGQVVYETTSAYQHIQVLDRQGIRILSFDGTMETRMSLANPLLGHFAYTECFQLPWLWNRSITNVLMIGLGGGSTQRAFAHYYPQITVETVELDPVVVDVAKRFFGFKESPTQKVHVMDGRVHLRRTQEKYDTIVVDAYTKTRYGSFIPHHLATREFFELAHERLTTNGVIAYNVMGSLHGWRTDVLGAMYKTMREVFPQVYLVPLTDSINVVLIGTKSAEQLDAPALRQRATSLIREGIVKMPTFHKRLLALRTEPPANFDRSPVLTDDFAPVDGLLKAAPNSEKSPARKGPKP